MRRFSANRRERPPAGEAGVWLASLGLATGLAMIVGLLALIIHQGVLVFWPKPVARIELSEQSPYARPHGPLIGGIVAGERVRMTPSPRGRAEEREWHLRIGNREVYGQGFRYISKSAMIAVSFPSNAIVLERMEYGHAVGEPLWLERPDGARISAEDAAFPAILREELEKIRRLRRQLLDVEKHRIGRINHKMRRLHLERVRLDSDAGRAREAKLRAQFEELAGTASRLRLALQQGGLGLRLYTGEEHVIPLGQLVEFHYPNRMNFLGKLLFWLKGVWRFLSEEPREANTEGGILPAIFGTFVMTLLMSVAVMPFGVLAAIYLREYARQSLFTRAVRISVNNLAGVPSIVFGVFGLGFFVYFAGGSIDRLFFAEALPTPTFGTGGILWASLTLALMTVPVVIVASEEALASVPRGVREGSLALGASKWQTIYRVVLPAAAPGIMTGLILAMARGAGEVAPLMLVGVVKLAPSLPVDSLFPFLHLERKFMHLGFHIYDLGFQSPDSDAARPMVFATTLFLIALVVLLNIGAIVIRERLRRKYATGAF